MAGDKRNPVKGLLAGAVAGIVGSAAMDLYWAGVRNALGERPEQKPKVGGNQQKNEPSTQMIADKLSEGLTGHEVPKKHKAEAGVAVHYATGAVSGAFFGLAMAMRPKTGLLGGLLYGIMVWLFLDEIVLRVLDLSPDAEEVPLEEHIQALGAHLVFGATTEIVTRLFIGKRQQ